MDDDVADLLADLGAAGFAYGYDVVTDVGEPRREVGDLGGFATSFGTFEGDQYTGGFFFQRQGGSVAGLMPVGEEAF
jgi:hypothetical protein